MKAIVISWQKILTLRYVIYLLSYAIPLVFTHPQIVTGSIVNALLFISSEKLNKKDLLPIYVLPSLGAVTLGILFGPQTFFSIIFCLLFGSGIIYWLKRFPLQ